MPKAPHYCIAKAVKMQLANHDVSVEVRFTQINRIADLVWQQRKVIFEIQCSFIEPKEVLARIKDYESIGYDVIWLLDDAKFNQTYLTKAEVLMRDRGGKYVHVGNSYCLFYDQVEQRIGRKMVAKSPSMPIELPSMYLRVSAGFMLSAIPKSLQYQWRLARHLFPGQALDLFLKGKLTYFPIQTKSYLSQLKRGVRWVKKVVTFFITYYIHHTYKEGKG